MTERTPETSAWSESAASTEESLSTALPGQLAGEIDLRDLVVRQMRRDTEVDAQVRRQTAASSAMISIASADGKLEYVSHKVLEMLGASFAELAGMGWINFLHPDDAKGALEEWSRRGAEGLLFQYYCRIRSRDGTYRWCQSLVKPLFAKGKIVKFYGCLSDADALHGTEDSLLDSEQALRLLMDSVPTLVWRASVGEEGGSSTSSAAHGASTSNTNAKTRILDLSQLAAVALEQLQLITASRFAGDALNMAHANGMNETIAAGCAGAVLAHVQYELGDLDRAELLILAHLPAIRTLGTADVVIKAYTILSHIALHRARYEQASALLDEGKAVGGRICSARVVLTMMAERVRIWISQREFARAHEEFEAMQHCACNFQSTARHVESEIEQICELTRWRLALAEGHAVDAVTPLRALCHAARSAQRRYTEFTLTLELSGALDLSGEHATAEHLLTRALQRSERYGLFQCWVDAGTACNTVLLRLVSRLKEGGPNRNTYLVSLLSHRDSHDRAPQHARRIGPREIERLSARECAVLALIAKGQSNKRIAQTLKITPETVKSHLKRTFIKLESKTRAEAVARATELGFLSGSAALQVPSNASASRSSSACSVPQKEAAFAEFR